MDLYNAVRQSFYDDEGVSPVIAVILMVAITVVLAATVYVWVSGFASDDTGPEQASATAKGFDRDDNGDVDHVRVTLTSGNNAPYDVGCDADPCSTDAWNSSDVAITGSRPSGASDAQVGAEDILVTAGGSVIGNTDSWDAGETWFIDCEAAGNMALTVAVGSANDKTTILDTTVSCDE